MQEDLDVYLKLPFNQSHFELERDFLVYVEVKGERHEWVIAKGTNTDFASIPSVLHWWLSPTDARIAVPALIHDSMYARKVFTRGEADRVLFTKCLSFNLPVTKAIIVYLGVRLFGRRHYNK